MNERSNNLGREEIIIEKAFVRRPKVPWSKDIQRFLRFLQDQQINYVPKPLGFDQEEHELVSFVPGEVYDQPLPDELYTDEVLCLVAERLRDFHDRSVGFLERLTGEEQWMLEYSGPTEVMCHNDFAPYNMTIVDGEPFGLFYFDTVRPGSRLWDVSYAAYRWVPLYFDGNSRLSETQCHRLKLFVDTYRLSNNDRVQIVDCLIDRLCALVAFMSRKGEEGNGNFQKNIDEGHLAKYQYDIQCLKENKSQVIEWIKIEG